MAFKGTAGKSASGASMSKYDVKVEARLQKLEDQVMTLSQQLAANQGAEADVVAVLKKAFPGKALHGDFDGIAP